MESRARSFAKAISYRTLASISTAGLVFLVTGSIKISLGAGLVDSVLKFSLYFLHERVWEHISYGKPKAPEYEI